MHERRELSGAGESHQKKCSARVRLELQEETVGRSKKGGVGGEGEGVTYIRSARFNSMHVG